MKWNELWVKQQKRQIVRYAIRVGQLAIQLDEWFT